MDKPVAIIVGASQGIGAATARALADMGAFVLLAARRQEKCDRVAQAIDQQYGPTTETAHCDATSYTDVEQLVRGCLRHHGRIDFLINNVGRMNPMGQIEDCDAKDWGDAISVNLQSAFHGCKAVLPHFREHGGVIINLSSGAGFHPLEGWSAYCAAKAGLAMFTQVLARETANSPVRVYGFQPGMVNSQMSQAASRVKVNRVADLDPATFADPTEPALGIAWLCKNAPQDLCGTEIDMRDPVFRERIGMVPVEH